MDSNSRRSLRVDLCHASPAKVWLFLPWQIEKESCFSLTQSGISSTTVSGPSLDIVAVAVNKICLIFTTDPSYAGVAAGLGADADADADADAGVAAGLGGASGHAVGNA